MERWLRAQGYGPGMSPGALSAIAMEAVPRILEVLCGQPTVLGLAEREMLLYLLFRLLCVEAGRRCFEQRRIANLRILLWHHNEELAPTRSILSVLSYKSMFFEKARSGAPMRYTIVVDKSGSMVTVEHGRSRWAEAQAALEHIIGRLTPLSLLFFSSNLTAPRAIADKAAVRRAFGAERPTGSTNAALVVRTVLERWLAGDRHPEHIVIITDGEPDSKELLTSTLVEYINRLPDGDGVGITFLQVGRNHEAAEFLHELQDHLVEGGARWPIVDSLSHIDYHGLSFCDMVHAQLPGPHAPSSSDDD